MSDFSQGGRGESRGETARRSSASLRGSFRDTGAVRIPLAMAAKVHRAADLVRARAERHHETHSKTKVAKAYTRLLLKSSLTLSLTPPGMMSDPKAALMDRAVKEVAHGQAQRLARIDKARASLLSTGKLRQNRDLQWGGERSNGTVKTADTARSPANMRGTSRQARSVNAKVSTAQDRARRKAEAHLVKHQEQWTGRRFDQLTSAFGISSGKAPSWAAQHIHDAAMDIANRGVKDKHEARLQRIDRACENMRSSGQVRESRPVGRNVALER
jgi:hypothetical protein